MEGSKEDKEWKNAIRHNLSLGKKLFTKVPREVKGSFWLLNPGVELSDSKKTAAKTKKPNVKNPNNPTVPKPIVHSTGTNFCSP